MMAISFSGIQLGIILFLPFSSFLCDHGFDGGWASIFYISGLSGLSWSILFLLIFSDIPEKQRFISKLELDYILKVNEHSSITSTLTSFTKTPWKAILSSRLILMLCFCLFCFNMGHYFYITQLPKYINEVLKLDIKKVFFI